MTVRLRHISILQAAKVLGLCYMLLAIPLAFILLPIMRMNGQLPADAAGGALVGAVVTLPLIYGAAGFLLTLIACAIYNAVAAQVGGVEFELESGEPDRSE